MKILMRDSDLPETSPLTRFRSVFSIRNGIFSEKERIEIVSPGAELYFSHPDKEYEKRICSLENMKSFHEESPDPDGFYLIIESQHLSPFRMLREIGHSIDHDIPLLTYRGNYFSGAAIKSGEFLPAFSESSSRIVIVGPPDRLYVHDDIEILPGSVFDTRKGSIILDAGVKISPFSYLEGPLYAGKNTRIDGARITGGSILGHDVRAGGEIENSIIGDFSNKHHEGFLGHSVLGSWVNMGALATTSDLKNNYGEVRLLLPDGRPSDSDLKEIPSGTIKFGSVIGDCVKISIGTMLNTGTVIDAGSNIFGGNPGKYTPPLSWGLRGEKYDAARFFRDQEIIFSRRDQTPGSELKSLIHYFIS